MEAQVVEYRSGEPREALFGGLGFLVLAGVLLLFDLASFEMPAVLAAIAAFSLWKAFRRWKLPVARLTGESLEIYSKGKVAHFISLERIQKVEAGLNSTVINLHNGAILKVSHVDFLWSADAKAFTRELRNRIATA